MNRARKSLLSLNLIYRSKFFVDFTKTWPIFSLIHVNKCREIKSCIVADILATCFFGGVEIKVSDALINCSYIFEFCDKSTNILKSSASYNL